MEMEKWMEFVLYGLLYERTILRFYMDENGYEWSVLFQHTEHPEYDCWNEMELFKANRDDVLSTILRMKKTILSLKRGESIDVGRTNEGFSTWRIKFTDRNGPCYEIFAFGTFGHACHFYMKENTMQEFMDYIESVYEYMGRIEYVKNYIGEE